MPRQRIIRRSVNCICTCGKKIRIYEGMTHPYNYTNLLSTFNVSTIDELARAYKCKRCRSGRIIQRDQEPPSEVLHIENVEVPPLTITGQGIDTDIKKYSNLYVGFEFEGNHKGSTTLSEVAQRYNLPIGKTLGKAKITKRVELATGGVITLPVDDDLYKHPGLVSQVYNDGTVEIEVVTRPVHVFDLNIVKEVFDYCKRKIDMKIKNAGLHMTFLLNHHKELSKYDDLVVKNILQLTRYYYAPLCYLFRQTNRGTSYRPMPGYNEVNSLETGHHSAINLRKDGNQIWGLEIRIPDGTDSWDVLEAGSGANTVYLPHFSEIGAFRFISFKKIFQFSETFYSLFDSLRAVPSEMTS